MKRSEALALADDVTELGFSVSVGRNHTDLSFTTDQSVGDVKIDDWKVSVDIGGATSAELGGLCDLRDFEADTFGSLVAT